ncbi:MAG: DUF4019 domain-containing protein [Planctomycetota bacterium]|jgi:hypothetical protein
MADVNSVSYYEQGEYEGDNPILKFGLIFGLIFLIAALAALGLFYKVGSASSQLSPHCELYLAAVQSGNYDNAYSMIAPEWKEQQNESQFRNFNYSLKRIIGTLYAKKMQREEMKATPSGSQALVVYNASFTNADPCLITFTLYEKGGIWMVGGVNYQTPVLMQFQPCPDCGTLKNIMKPQCPKCVAMEK